MKRTCLILAIVCVLLCFAIMAFASGPQVLVQGTAAGTTQIRLSTVDGTAFLDGDSTIPCTSFIGEHLEIVDSAGKKISGFIKAAGSGETLDVELISNGTFDSDLSGWFVESTGYWVQNGGVAEKTTANSGWLGQDLNDANERLVKFSFDLVVTSGYISVGARIAGNSLYTGTYSTSGTKTGYAVLVASPYQNFAFGYNSSSDTLLGTVDNVSVKKVLTPSSTGCTIVSTSGGSTYNWSKETGFDPNSASFKWRILSTNIPGKQIAGGSLTAANVRLATVDGGAMVHMTDVDLSGYAGDDTGGPLTIINPKSTSAATMTTNKYLLALYDSSGRVATGYVGAVGGGETLGSELATDGTFDNTTKETAKSVVSITKANPGVVTFGTGHGYANGDVIYFSGLTEMTELNTKYYQLRQNSGDTFQLSTTYDSTSLDTSGYGSAESTGGNCAQKVTLTSWTNAISNVVPSIDGAGALTNKAFYHNSTLSYMRQDMTWTTGWLYKLSVTISSSTGSGTNTNWYGPMRWNSGYAQSTINVSDAEKTSYQTKGNGETNFGIINTGWTFLADGMSVKQVTDIAATGVHLHSTPNATDRKMAIKTSGFDPNAVTSYKIYRVY